LNWQKNTLTHPLSWKTCDVLLFNESVCHNEMSSGSEPDGDFGGDVESYDSQREEEIENENAEREGNQKRQLSGDESEENNYQPEKKKHKSGHKSKKRDKKQRAERG